MTYQVRLANGLRVRVNVFAVYNHPREVEREDGEIEYEWPCLSRRACPKEHCEVTCLIVLLMHVLCITQHAANSVCMCYAS